MKIVVLEMKQDGNYKEGHTYSDGAILASLAGVKSVEFTHEGDSRLAVVMASGTAEISLPGHFRFYVEEDVARL